MPTRLHSRHSSAVSVSSAVRSSSPSPSASPISPTTEGLSRRLSWNRSHDDTLSVQDVRPSVVTSPPFGAALAPPSHINHVVPYLPEELDLGAGWVAEPPTRQPFLHTLESETSLETVTDSNGDGISPAEETDQDQQMLRAGPSAHRRQPSRRAYGSDGLSMSSGPSRLAAAVTRSPTFRSVSRTLRQASIRVVNIMGADNEHRMVRLQDEEEDVDSKDAMELEARDDGLEGSVPPPRPAPRPPEGRLRGRTLCFFTARSRMRRTLDGLLRNRFTEPAILVLIIVNVVVLAIQAAPSLSSPRPDSGYFQSWTDVVLLALFAVFTVEMLARIITTGLVFDPDTSLRDFLFSPSGVVPRVKRRLARNSSTRHPTTMQRTPSRIMPRPKAAWRSTSAPSAPAKKPTLISEAPFQKAVAKQQSLSAAGRPYLRHSWHRIDMIAIISFWITFILASAGQEATATRHIYIFRALSVLRAGRLLVITSGTTTILHSLKRAGPLLVTVAYFVIFAAVLFSIIGVQSFRGSFRRICVLTDPNNATNTIQLSQQCGGYLDPSTLQEMTYLNLDGSQAPGAPKGYICPLNQVCITNTVNPQSGAQSFDNVLDALIQVIVIGSINTWSPTMYQAMDSDFYSSSLYWLVAVMVINFWLINLVVAVVVNTFKDIRADTKKSAFGADDKMTGMDAQWPTGTADRKPPSTLITRMYEKTHYFWVALVLADLVAQAFKTASSPQSTIDLLKSLELAFTMAFDLEIVVRIAGCYPDWRAFLSRPHNGFDLFLAIACSIIQIPAIASNPIAPWLSIFQLLRWYRFILAFPRMKPLLMQLFGSFAGLLNMVVFLLIINFIGALVVGGSGAVQLFRGDLASDQLISFSQTYNSFLGMYQIFSSENWTTILYAAMSSEFPYVQGWLAAIFLCGWFLFANFIVLQMFVAVINENFAVAEEQKRKQQIEAFIRKTEPQSAHVSWIDRLNPYRLMRAAHTAVKVQSLPPNLVLPLRQTAGTDIGRYEEYLESTASAGTKGAVRRLFGLEAKEKDANLRQLQRPRSAQINHIQAEDEDDRGLTDLLPPLNAGPSVDEHLDALRERRNQQADFIAAHPSFDQSLWLFKQGNPARRICQSCFDPAYGERIYGRPARPILRLVAKGIIFAAIVASIVVAAIARPLYRKDYYLAHGLQRGTWFDIVEVSIGMLFVVEAGMKIIADGFIFAPNAYLLSIWNIIDFAILITLIVDTTTSLIFLGGLSAVTRSLRAFRALRLITLFSRLRDTLHAVLFAGALRIMDAAILMMLYLIPFAVWGLNIFAGRLYSCNDGTAAGKSDFVSEFLNSPVDNSLNFLAPRVWATPGLVASTTVWSFDSFRTSLLILFEIVSLEGWIDVMNAAMSIVGLDTQTQTNAAQWNSIFFLIFNLFGAVLILTLFVTIIIENFSNQSGMALLTSEQRQWVDLSKFIRAQTPSQLPKNRPQFGIRLWCYDRATQKHGYWARGFTMIYYLHILLLAFEDFSQNIMTDVQLDWVFLFLTMLYAVDLLVRFYGLGPNSFRANGWNIFDLVVITGSFATTIPDLQAVSRGVPPNEVNTQLQKLFLVSIALKLVQRVSSLNQLFKTSVASLPAIGNLFLLWAILFFFYTILNLEVFGLAKIGNNAGTRFQNYYSFGNTLIMLAFMSTGEGWNGYMHDYTISFPRCTMSDDYLLSDCGSSGWAFGLFLSWNILSMYIFLNMFTGVVVESFAYVYQMPGGASLNREDMRAFKRVWADFDTDRSGYIKRKDFVRFFSKLLGVFEVRAYPVEYTVHNLVRASIPDPVENASGKLLVANGVRQAVDIRRVEALTSQIDYKRVRERRNVFARLYNEARISDEGGRGISFTAMLMMLAHYKLIDDEKALQLDDLLLRRAKTERVTDLVNLDRVRGLLRTIYWRRRFLASRDERRRTLAAEAEGIPAIVLEPMPATPPLDRDADNEYSNPFETREATPSPPPSPSARSSPAHTPLMCSVSLGHSPVMSASGRRLGHSPSLSVSTQPRRATLSRQVSNASMLSSEDAHWRRDSPADEDPREGFMEDMATSVWDDMMREAVDHEEA